MATRDEFKDCVRLNASERQRLLEVLDEIGAGFGYASLSEAAAAALESITVTSSLEESRRELLKLRDVIKHLKPEFQAAA